MIAGKKNSRNERTDVIVVGAGIGGSFMAYRLASRGLRVLLIEAGRHYNAATYPRNEMDANSTLYWSGGMELDDQARLIILRPKAVGGGSVVNQALVDRFDDIALDSWRKDSGIEWFNSTDLRAYYDRAEAELAIQEIPEKYANGNAVIFREGFKKNGYGYLPLRRAQSDCRYEDGNDCVECLSGCRIDSKQSMGITVLKKAAATGHMTLLSETEVCRVRESADQVEVDVRSLGGVESSLTAKYLVMSSGAIGNTRILLQSGWKQDLPALGEYFFSHPQYMHLGLYDHPIRSHKGPFQTYKSNEPRFREQGFKLENVFAPPVAISMLIPGGGATHQQLMGKMDQMACIEVAIRDSNPGRIGLRSDGRLKIVKRLDEEDRKRKARGVEAMHKVFQATGAKQIISASFGIGLHLMGACRMGKDRSTSVVDPDFKVHGKQRTWIADGSLFPNAPGINPSLTIMALAHRAADAMLSAVGGSV